jgi:Flp pilus assembly protein TadD
MPVSPVPYPKRRASGLAEARALFAKRDFRRAFGVCKTLTVINPRDADALHLLGACCTELGLFGEAQEALTKSLVLSPREPGIHNTLGNLRRAEGDFAAAVTHYEKALSLERRSVPALHGLGISLRALSDVRNSIAALREAVSIQPRHPEFLCELGLSLEWAGDRDEALETLRQAEALSLGSRSRAGSALANALLVRGRLEEGWKHYVRSRTNVALPSPKEGLSVFSGKDVELFGDEGLGDEIMSAACFDEVSRVAHSCTIHCDPRLKTLFERSFPALRVEGYDKIGAKALIGSLSEVQFNLPTSLLPAYVWQRPPPLPRSRAHLQADAKRSGYWRGELSKLGGRRRIGISWRGGSEPETRSQRSMDAAALVTAVSSESDILVSIQHGDVAVELDNVRVQTGRTVHRLGGERFTTDTDDFASFLTALDLVISVDNTGANLAGAIGTETWVLLPFVPNWRWGFDERVTAWYPSVELLRQRSPGDWSGPLAEVASRMIPGQ